MDRSPFARLGAVVLSLTLVAGCGKDSTGPSRTGTLSLSVVTTGVDPDTDGYWLWVDRADPQPVPVNGTVTWMGRAGVHTFALSGMSFNCDSTPPRSETVTAGDTTRIALRLTCRPFLENAIVYVSEASGTPRLMAMRADGSRRQELTHEFGTYAAPAVSPDGQAIAVAVYTGGTWNSISLLDRFGHSPKRVIGNSPSDGSPAWSPDGQRIAFRSEVSDSLGIDYRIFVVDRDGTALRQLTPNSAEWTSDEGPAWSPDGTRVIYSRSGVLHVIGADGSGDTSLGVGGTYPAWSPDGRRIAYQAYVNNRYTAIFVADADGANARQITFPVEDDQYPRWSPDGGEITFDRVENNVLQIYRVAPDGTGVAKLSVSSRSEAEASWGPAVVPAAATLALPHP